jgi:hypothetical protein
MYNTISLPLRYSMSFSSIKSTDSRSGWNPSLIRQSFLRDWSMKENPPSKPTSSLPISSYRIKTLFDTSETLDTIRTAALRELYEETGYGGGDKGGGKATVRTVTPILVSPTSIIVPAIYDFSCLPVLIQLYFIISPPFRPFDNFHKTIP